MPTLTARERRELPDRAFAYIDRQGSRRLPINDEGHVRAALARFNQVQFEDDDARAEAFKRLLLAARKYGIVPIGFMTRQLRPRAGSSAKTPKLPTGLVTLLFTDIEASTGLLEMFGDGYIDILNDVRSLMRDAVGSARGVEVDARADEFFAAFRRASDAVQAALAIQWTLRKRRWPGGIKVLVRAGIHSGTPKLTEGSYVGLPVHTANRICSAAHGGQILISDQAHEAMDGAAPAGVSLRELGPFRLRGIARGHVLFQVEAPGLPVTFPPPREAGAVPATSGR
jgi:class 3 adenylate cyclase